MQKYDILIVGAGFAGLVFAERACNSLGKRCLVVEKRNHIGGNAQDSYDVNGVLIHNYGPHYFRTNSDRIKEYLSNFTEWHPVEYKIKSFADGEFVPFPINLNTFEALMGKSSTSEEFEAWLISQRVEIEKPKNSEEVIVSQVGWELYEKFFKGYTIKQWKCDPKELDVSVCGRIPIRTNRDDRYLTEKFQALPKHGYHKLFDRIVRSCGANLQIMLDADYQNVKEMVEYDHLVYTGPVDQFYKCCYGALPYRSLRFEKESFTSEDLAVRKSISGKENFWQPAMQVNYPGKEPFTRIVEIKHATGQDSPNSTIVREYPQDFGEGKEPYYPLPTESAQNLYKKYKALADQEKNVSFVGRLATYRYYNMDQVVGMALAEFDKYKKSLPS
ncbi:MAG: UDP-galactopyranose mutase [Pirellulales bacterium]|nr:UDP-galactopyranose mutase [Pirellulales bacterium]